MPFFFWDWTMILLVPALLLSLYAQWKVSSTFKKYSKVPSAFGRDGAQAARRLLDGAGLSNVSIEVAGGSGLSDHYDPRSKTLRLSKNVGGSSSLAALGVAAHEVGHAVQDAREYTPMRVRGSLVPVANLGSSLGIILFMVGFFLGDAGPLLMNLGIVFFSGAVLFTLVTLPVEFNASSRAMAMLSNQGILSSVELDGARTVLRAAALTYVAAALMAILQLVRLVLLSQRR